MIGKILLFFIIYSLGTYKDSILGVTDYSLNLGDYESFFIGFAVSFSRFHAD